MIIPLQPLLARFPHLSQLLFLRAHQFLQRAHTIKHLQPRHDHKVRIADLLPPQERASRRRLTIQRRDRLDVRSRVLERLGSAVLRVVAQRLERRAEALFACAPEVGGGGRVEERQGNARDLEMGVWT